MKPAPPVIRTREGVKSASPRIVHLRDRHIDDQRTGDAMHHMLFRAEYPAFGVYVKRLWEGLSWSA